MNVLKKTKLKVLVQSFHHIYCMYIAYRSGLANGLCIILWSILDDGRRGGLMVTALDEGLNGSGSSPGRGHCVVFFGRALYSHHALLHPDL